MLYFEIRSESGREIQFSRDNYIYLKEPDKHEHFWQWNQFDGREKEITRICEKARELAVEVEALLPDQPMSAVR